MPLDPIGLKFHMLCADVFRPSGFSLRTARPSPVPGFGRLRGPVPNESFLVPRDPPYLYPV